MQHGIEIPRTDERDRQTVQALADGVVLLAEVDQLLQLGFERAVLLAQREDLALGDRDGATSVRMRNVDVG